MLKCARSIFSASLFLLIRQLHVVSGLIISLFILLLAFSSAHASPGTEWLRDQSQSSGLINTSPAVASDWAATAESVRAFSAFGESILTSLALTADSQGRDRLTGVPIIVFGGNQFPGHANHILDAQTGRGSNNKPITFALNRTPPWPRGWLASTVECNSAARIDVGGGVDCDEYPFATSRQGGQYNSVLYNGVSLRLLESEESRRTGGFITTFYIKAGITADGLSRKSRFLVLGIPGIDSFYTDRKGVVFRDGWR